MDRIAAIKNAGFAEGEFAQAAQIRRLIAEDKPLDAEQIAAWSELSAKWSIYADAVQRHEAQQTAQAAQADTQHHAADPTGALGAAMRENHVPYRAQVRRTQLLTTNGVTRLVFCDTGEEVRDEHRASSGAGRGIDRIAQAFARDERRTASGALR